LQQGGTLTREVALTYDSEDLFPETVTNGLGHTSRTIYHRGLGLLAFAEDPNHVTAHYYYDGFGRPRGQRTDGQDTISISYKPGAGPSKPPNGTSVGLYSVQTDAGSGGQSVVTFNALGDEVARATRNHDGTYSFVETKYTVVAGLVASVSLPHAASVAVRSASFETDWLGRSTKSTLPDGSIVTTHYNGRATTVTDAKGISRTEVVDELGHAVRIDENAAPAVFDPKTPYTRPATAISTTYAYGPFGVVNDVALTDRAGVTTTLIAMKYDALGRRTQLTDGDSGQSATTYDGFGEVVKSTDGNGDTHVLTRDAIGRVERDVSNRDGLTVFEWDTAAHGIGKLAKVTSPDQITTAYAYDAYSRANEQRWRIAGADYAVETVFDTIGRATALRYPSVGGERFGISFGFDAIGAVSSATSTDPGSPLSWTAEKWQADGRLTQATFGTDASLGLTTRTYDPNSGRLTDIVSATLQEKIQRVHYGYDANGVLSRREDRVLGTTETFDHDWLNRLQGWTFASSKGTWATTFDYSDLGNIRQRKTTGDGGTTLDYGYGTRDAGGSPGLAGVHALTSLNGGAYKYDAKGNQRAGSDREVRYTSFNLPRSIDAAGGSTQFQYDAHHSRAMKKRDDGTSTVYVGGLYEKRESRGVVTHVFHVPGIAQVEWTYPFDEPRPASGAA
jgi:YD repeat-containing protein